MTTNDLGKVRTAAHLSAMVFEMAGELKPKSSIAGIQRRVRQQLAQAAERAEQRAQRRKALARNVGGAVAVGGLAVAVIFQTTGSLRVPTPAVAEAVYTAGAGEWKSVILPDGSTAVLDERTRIVMALDGQRREIRMGNGRAHFKVRKDARLFIVRVGQWEAVALGTEFGVRNGPSGRSISLVEGRLCVRPVGSSTLCDGTDKSQGGILMTAGQVLNLGQRPGLPKSTNLDREQSWAKGYHLFADMPLARVVQEVNRYSARDIRFDSTMASIRVHAIIKIGDTETLARQLQNLRYGRIVTRTQDTITFAPYEG